MMSNGKLLSIGVVGSLIAAVCCFTPVLVVLLGAFGLSAALSYLDAVLIPVLLVFLALTGYALWQRQRSNRS